MGFIRNLIISLVVGGAVAITATAAQAAVYNYSFTNDVGNTAGTVMGAVTLADGDGVDLAASSVTITDISWLVGDILIEFISPGVTVVTNNFTVAGGLITDYSFVGFFGVSVDESLHLREEVTSLFFLDNEGQAASMRDSNGTTFTPVSAVPLPAAFPLYGAGIAVLGFMGWRRRRNA